MIRKETWESIEVLGFWGFVYHRFFYRSVMRFAHRFDWHYAPRIGPMEDGRTQLWCTWCGFRETQGVAHKIDRGTLSKEASQTAVFTNPTH